jgi:putative transposase
MSDNPQNMTTPEGHKPNRRRVILDIGSLVEFGNEPYRINEILDFNTAIGINLETGRSQALPIAELNSVAENETYLPAVDTDIEEITKSDLRIANEHFLAIKPLISDNKIGRQAVVARAKEVNIDPSTLYRWLQRYRSFGTISALIPRKRGWSPGRIRIPHETDVIIDDVIKDYYLNLQRPSVQKTVVEVFRRCHERGLRTPATRTIRSRISNIPERERLRGRGYREKANNKFLPVPGSFPNATFPLSVIQIDHTLADIFLVDDIDRKSSQRPYLTVALDVYSRMVVGYYLSFDAPSEASDALCVAHAILPKDEWLVLHSVNADWPVWGIPRTIYVDNGADFRSENFRTSCLQYGINLEFRPVKTPRYGGAIERFFGTLSREIHALPGTTFSSVKDREGYDSEKNSAMTLAEFEKWLVTFICKKYHQSKHSALGMSPSRMWEIGIHGNASTQGIGLPPRPANRLTILLDFLPAYRRSIQHNGVNIENAVYYSEALRPWINAMDLDSKEKRKFIFRRDPRDISSVWFFDPKIKEYFQVPFADQRLPSMSAWEFKEVKKAIKDEGSKSITDGQLFTALTEMRTIIDESKEKTKSARQKAQRRRVHEKKISPAAPLATPKPQVPQVLLELEEGDIEDFGEIS